MYTFDLCCHRTTNDFNMFRCALLLFFVQTSLAASAVTINTQYYNYAPVSYAPDVLVSSDMINQAFAVKDQGENNIYILTMESILYDLAQQTDPLSITLALAQGITMLAETGSVRPGDACAYAALINAANGYGDVQSALTNYVATVNAGIDTIVALSANSATVWAIQPSQSCPSNSRWYNIDATWASIISANPSNAGLLNEEYCAARRLTNAWNVRSINVGSAVTASVTAPALSLWGSVINQSSDFMKAIASGGDSSAAASALKTALINACA